MKASLTVEAALVMSLCILILAWLMGETLKLYEDVRLTAKEAAVEELNPIEWFYTYHLLKQEFGREGK